MAQIKIDFNHEKGPIKPVNGVGQVPIVGWCDSGLFRYLTEAGIPYSRLHDVGGGYGANRFVDIPNVFRDFDADPSDPASYDFAFTDVLLADIVKAGIEPYYRLGITIENAYRVRAMRIAPPKDFLKWAKICEGVISHYTEGWANGFHYEMKYWEIWNECDQHPDENGCSQMWGGTFEQYLELYEVSTKYLKARFPHLKFGGYASCGFTAAIVSDHPEEDYLIQCLDKFLAYVKEHDCPLDFFSWHSYELPGMVQACANYVQKRLDEAGYGDVEHHCNEWNTYNSWTERRYYARGTPQHAAGTAATLIALQDSPTAAAMFYDARVGVSGFGGLFNPMTLEPLKAYYPFLGFHEIVKRGTEVATDSDTKDVWALTAKGKEDAAMMIVNFTAEEKPLALDLDGAEVVSCRITDADHDYDEVALPPVLDKYAVLYLTLRRG